MSLKTMCLVGLAKHQGSGEDGGEHMVEDLRAPSPKARLANPPLLEDHRLPSGLRQYQATHHGSQLPGFSG